jgi:hypothetical protein
MFKVESDTLHPVIVVTNAVSAEDKDLLMSITGPTLENYEGDVPTVCSSKDVVSGMAIPTEAGTLVVPFARTSSAFTPPETKGFECPARPSGLCRKRHHGDSTEEEHMTTSDEEGLPKCATSLIHRFETALRTKNIQELTDAAALLCDLKFDDPATQALLSTLSSILTQMIEDISAEDSPAALHLQSLTKSLRTVYDVLCNPPTPLRVADVLQDVLYIVPGVAPRRLDCDPPTLLQLLLAHRKLNSIGILPPSPTAETHGKHRRTQGFTAPREPGGALAHLLSEAIALLKDANSAESARALKGVFSAIAEKIAAMAESIPGLAISASTLIPRLSKLRNTILMMPPVLTHQDMQHLYGMLEAAQAETTVEKEAPSSVVVVHNMCEAVRTGATALGLMSASLELLANASPFPGFPECLKALAENELGRLWSALQWMGDSMVPVTKAIDTIVNSLDALDFCIADIENDRPADEVLRTLGTILQASMEASRVVADLLRPKLPGCTPSEESILPRLMDCLGSVVAAAEDASQAMAALTPA